MAFDKIKATTGGGGTEKAPAGNHAAVLVGLFDMGHQWQEPFSAKDKGYWAHRAFFVWELVNEKVAGATKNHVIGIDLTLSLGEKAKLRKFIEGRTGKKLAADAELDPMTELGQACLLNVIEKNGYPKIEGVAALPKGMPAPAPGYKPVAVGLEEFRAGGVSIPEWVPYLYGSPLADHIKASREIGEPKPVAKKKDDAAPKTADAKSGDPIPF